MTIHARDLFAPLTGRLAALFNPAPAPVKPARKPRKRKPAPKPVFRSCRAPVAYLPAPVAPTIEMPDLRPVTTPAPDLAHWLDCRTLHAAPAGEDVARWSPQGFPTAIWTDAQMRAGGPRPSITKGGRIQLMDRRKAWQKRGLQACSVSRCGTIVRMKSGDTAPVFSMVDGTARESGPMTRTG